LFTTVTVPAGQTAVLADLTFRGPARVDSTSGTVVMDRVTVQHDQGLTLYQSRDVRLHAVDTKLIVSDSRYEVSSSFLHGRNGSFGGSETGYPALTVSGDSPGVVARTSCIGGNGANIPTGLAGNGGDGGHGIWLNGPGPELVLAGGGVATIRGGEGGYTYSEFDGEDGDGLRNSRAGVWRSGSTFIAGSSTFSGALPIRYTPGPVSFDTPITPDDPTLELVGTAVPGGSVDLVTHARPGTIVRMTLGLTADVHVNPNIRVPRLVSRSRSYFLGDVPASGQITLTPDIPVEWPVGGIVYIQSRVLDLSIGELRRTNSVPVLVR